MYLPEKLVKASSLTKDDLNFAYLNKIHLALKVRRWNEELNALELETDGFLGIIPVNEITIYPIQNEKKDEDIEIETLLGRKIVCQITDLDLENDIVFFSRKVLMQEALEFIKTQKYIPKANILNFHNGVIFCDIGYGIRGKMLFKDFTLARYGDHSASKCKKGRYIPVNIFGENQRGDLFKISYRETVWYRDREICYNLSIGDIIECTIAKKLDDDSGSFFEFLPNASGIIDTKKFDFLLDESGDFLDAEEIQNLIEGKKAKVLIKSMYFGSNFIKIRGRFISYCD